MEWQTGMGSVHLIRTPLGSDSMGCFPHGQVSTTDGSCGHTGGEDEGGWHVCAGISTGRAGECKKDVTLVQECLPHLNGRRQRAPQSNLPVHSLLPLPSTSSTAHCFGSPSPHGTCAVFAPQKQRTSSVSGHGGQGPGWQSSVQGWFPQESLRVQGLPQDSERGAERCAHRMTRSVPPQ